jgi:transposase
VPALRAALTGRFRTHQAFLRGTEIEKHSVPCSEQLTRLGSIPGLNRRTAEVIIAEVGVDMTAFPTAAQLASWAALCPGNNESAGKHHTQRLTRRAIRLLEGQGYRVTLEPAALSALLAPTSFSEQ